MIDKTTWVRERAYYLSEQAGHPAGREVDFWLQAEHDFKGGHVCVLCLGSCPFQEESPLTGGRHIAICTVDDIKKCRYRAENCNKLPILTPPATSAGTQTEALDWTEDGKAKTDTGATPTT